MTRNLGYLALPFLMAAAFVWTAPSLHATEEGGDDSAVNGPAYFLVSLVENFDTDTTGWTWDGTGWECDCSGDCECDCGEPPQGSDVLLVRIGTFVAGDKVGDTRYVSDVMPPPAMEDDNDALDQHQFTILGGVDTSGPNTVHLMSPVPGTVPLAVEKAFFNASNAVISPGPPPVIGFDALPDIATTMEIGQFIFEHQGNAGATLPDILNFLFTPQLTTPPPGEPVPPPNPMMECHSPCMAEGDLFAHSSSNSPLFNFAFAYDAENGSLDMDVCLLVEVSVNEQSVNLKKKGTIPVTIYASDTFSTDDIDEDTIEIGGVAPDKVNFSKNKAICHFSVQALIEAGVLDSSTTEVKLHAMLLDDMGCIQGTSPIHVK